MQKNASQDRRRLAAALAVLTAAAILAIRVTVGARRADGTVPEGDGRAITNIAEQADEDGKGSSDKRTAPTADALTQTPEDVLAMQKEFRERYETDDGEEAVREVFYVAEHATDLVGNVAVRNATQTLTPDVAALLEEGPSLTVADAAAPTVLIFHTHTSESYALNTDGLYYPDAPTHRTAADRNMLRIGDELCGVLARRGVGYIHDTNVYDDDYDGAYARSRETALNYLKQYPTLKIAVDVHRDALQEGGFHIKPTAVVNGKKAAQIMILTGAEENGIEFPHWESNLRFALSLQKIAQEKYTGLMKPVFFCPRRYNMDVTENAVLLEIGTEVNTLEEAIYSARLIGDVIADAVLAAQG